MCLQESSLRFVHNVHNIKSVKMFGVQPVRTIKKASILYTSFMMVCNEHLSAHSFKNANNRDRGKQHRTGLVLPRLPQSIRCTVWGRTRCRFRMSQHNLSRCTLWSYCIVCSRVSKFGSYASTYSLCVWSRAKGGVCCRSVRFGNSTNVTSVKFSWFFDSVFDKIVGYGL